MPPLGPGVWLNLASTVVGVEVDAVRKEKVPPLTIEEGVCTPVESIFVLVLLILAILKEGEFRGMI